MANLPMDIVNDVFHRLPASTLVRCRVLSKPCFSLIDSPDFIASHLKRTLETEEHLMILLRSSRLLRTVRRKKSPSLSILYKPAVSQKFSVRLTRERVLRVRSRFGERRLQSHKDKDASDDIFGYPYEIKVFSLKSNKWKRRHLVTEEAALLFENIYFHLPYRRGNGVLASNRLHWILVYFKGGIGFNTIFRLDLATDYVRILSFPHDVYCRGMDIGVLDGCLCVMCNDFGQVDVWIMREYGGEWSKFITVPQPETVVSFEFVRPLIYSKDRRKILLEINNGKLFCSRRKCQLLQHVKGRKQTSIRQDCCKLQDS
ncbi:hypothetical protein DY000_02000630 [Brassica cretica]|uniref:F-box domain-containing protein n=1 Tax=Brassica cretica TaxID=69181 RepID=A0ABQ7BT76_BRACR|nr:hypothetical protein DY000_02000630 [Brassica cretica]